MTILQSCFSKYFSSNTIQGFLERYITLPALKLALITARQVARIIHMIFFSILMSCVYHLAHHLILTLMCKEAFTNYWEKKACWTFKHQYTANIFGVDDVTDFYVHTFLSCFSTVVSIID